MANLKKINLGVFPAGEIPPPIEHTYKDWSKAIIDINAWVRLGFYVKDPDGNETIKAVVFDTDGTDGKVIYQWVDGDMLTPGKYEGLIWVADLAVDPTLRLASDLFVWEVKDGPGETPTG